MYCRKVELLMGSVSDERPAAGSVVPLPGFKAAFNPFGSALPNAPSHSIARDAPPYKWVGGLPSVKPHRDPEVCKEQQNARILDGRRVRDSAAKQRASAASNTELPHIAVNSGHFVDPVGAVRQRDGTLATGENWRPTLDGVGVRHGGVYRQPACIPRREDTSWRVFGAAAATSKPPLTALERVRAIRDARQLARQHAEALAKAQQTASVAMFRPEQDPHGRGNQRAMGGNFDGAAEGVVEVPARLPPVNEPVRWNMGTKPLRRSDVPHSRLLDSQSLKLAARSSVVPDRDRRAACTEQYRDDSHRTLGAPLYSDPAEQPTASYHHRVERSSRPALYSQPPKQQPWPMGNQGNRAKLATMDRLVSQKAKWDDPVIG